MYNRWANEETMKVYIQKIIVPYMYVQSLK